MDLAVLFTFENYLYIGIMEDPNELFLKTRDAGNKIEQCLLDSRSVSRFRIGVEVFFAGSFIIYSR